MNVLIAAAAKEELISQPRSKEYLSLTLFTVKRNYILTTLVPVASRRPESPHAAFSCPANAFKVYKGRLE